MLLFKAGRIAGDPGISGQSSAVSGQEIGSLLLTTDH
jgi:hypothetical protein